MAVIKSSAGKGLVQIWWPLYVMNRWPYQGYNRRGICNSRYHVTFP